MDVALIAGVGVFFLGWAATDWPPRGADQTLRYLARPAGGAGRGPCRLWGLRRRRRGVLAYALARPELRSGIVLAVAVALIGMAFGRIVSALVGDRTAFYPNWFYLLVELVAAARCCSRSEGGSGGGGVRSVGPAGQRLLHDGLRGSGSRSRRLAARYTWAVLCATVCQSKSAVSRCRAAATAAAGRRPGRRALRAPRRPARRGRAAGARSRSGRGSPPRRGRPRWR